MDWRRKKERALFGLKDWRVEFDLIVFLSKKLIFFWGGEGILNDWRLLLVVAGCACLLACFQCGKSMED